MVNHKLLIYLLFISVRETNVQMTPSCISMALTHEDITATAKTGPCLTGQKANFLLKWQDLVRWLQDIPLCGVR